MNITISPLDSGDWKDLKTIRLEALKSDPQAFGSSYEKESAYGDEKWLERLTDVDTCILIAKDENTPIGMVGYHIKHEAVDNAHLWGMFVKKEFRGKGLGRKLMQEIITAAKKVSTVKEISLDVNPSQNSAIVLYESLGFQKNGNRLYMMGDGLEHELLTMTMEVI